MKNTTFTRNTFQVKAIVCSIFLSSTLFLNAQSAGIFQEQEKITENHFQWERTLLQLLFKK